LSALAVIGLCLGAYVVFALGFHWLVAPTVAKGRAVVATPPAPAMVMSQPVAPPPAPAPSRSAVLPKPAAAPSPSPTAQLDLPSRFVAQPRPSPVPEARPVAKPKTTTTAADAADPKPIPRKPVARTVRQERSVQRNPWGDFAWSNNSGHSSRPWF